MKSAKRNKQAGSTLVVALVLLTIITMVSLYSLEGTNIQSKMVANSLFTSLTYHECRNEQEANIRYYNTNGGINREELLDLRELASPVLNSVSMTLSNAVHPPKSDSITSTWEYFGEAPASRPGYDLDVESPTVAYIYENNCVAQFRFAQNDQTLGAVVEGLRQTGNFE